MFAVKNNTGSKFSAKYDGIEYVFPVGEQVILTEDAAKHIFGLGLADKTEVLVRHGWLQRSSDHDIAMQVLNGFSFGSVNMVPVPEVQEAEDETEQRMSAPLQTGDVMEGTSDGVLEVADPTPPRRGNMIDNLRNG